MNRAFNLVATLAAASQAFLASGCTSEDPADEGQMNDSAMTAPDRCEVDGRGDPYSSGMAKTGDNGVTVELVESRPKVEGGIGAPGTPVRFDNVWELSITDADGNPLDGADVQVLPFMPDHGHPTNKVSVIKPMGDGQYDVDPVNFMMNGYWEVTVEVETEAISDSVIFKFCVGG